MEYCMCYSIKLMCSVNILMIWDMDYSLFTTVKPTVVMILAHLIKRQENL